MSAIALLLAALMLLALAARGATNDLTTTLQRGLFEEEANQNLAAAVQAYEAVASQFDKDRKLAATAIFRLGECYRKQGNTNAAAAQYDRILRDFSDQPTLITLSRQNLAVLGSAPQLPNLSTASEAFLAAEAERTSLANQIRALKKLPQDKLRVAVQQSHPNPVLTALMQKLVEAEQSVATLQKDFGPRNPEVLKANALVETVNKQIDEQVEGVLRTLEIKRDAAERAEMALGSRPPAGRDAKSDISTVVPNVSSEAEEVHRIQALIKDSPDLINAPDATTGETLLQSAAAKGKLAVVKVLLDNGAAVDGLQQPGLTALHYAAANGHKAIVDLLLSKGAKPDAQTEAGVTPLDLAAQKGYEEVAKALLAAGAPVNTQTKSKTSFGSPTSSLKYAIGAGQTPLHLAAAAGYPGMVELLLAKGAEPNVEDAEGRTPLSYAAQKPVIIQLLLAAHADPNAGRRDLPLAIAAYHGDTSSLKVLLTGGADPNTNAVVDFGVDARGSRYSGGRWSPLPLAVCAGQAEAVAELLQAKAEPGGLGPEDKPALYYALPNASILRLLLDAGANANHLIGGVTALNCAVKDRNQEAVGLLLAHEADANATDRTGWTPLTLAAAGGLTNIAELLLRNGADVNGRDHSGKTPLHQAVIGGYEELAALLLANHANPNARNNMAQTPLDLAKSLAQQGSRSPAQRAQAEAIVALLLQHGAVEDLPQPDRLIVQRHSTGYSEPLLTKGTNDWNEFTVLELLGMQYGFLSASPDVGAGDGYSRAAFYYARSRQSPRLGFPDFAHLRIRRPTADMKGWQEQDANLSALFGSGDCTKDVRLRWGDVLEIPEAEHPLNEQWGGFSTAELENLKKCLTRWVEVVIKGQVRNLTLAPGIAQREGTFERDAQGSRVRAYTITAPVPFWLKPALLGSRLVLTSSDLSRVKVTRRDPETGEERQWIINCSESLRDAPGFWLRDGDRIEVPEKGETASASDRAVPQGQEPAVATASSAGEEQAKTALPQAAPVQRLRKPPVQSVQAEEQRAESGIRYSPKPDDSALLNAGYHRDRSARTRKADYWEERATSELSSRACPAVWTGTEMVVFGGEGMGTSFADGARYCLAEDTWAMLPEEGEPSSRTGQIMVWTGKEMIVWGGFGGVWGDDTNHNDGARYNPSTDRWSPMTTRKAPEARFDLTAVWSGRELLVWGGYTDSHSRYQGAHADAFVNTGGRYNPSSDTWKPITTEGAPSRRSWNSAVWTGKEMIVWGGINANKVLRDGGRYDPVKDSWKPVSTDGAPSARGSHVAVWTGKEMIVWGGSTRDPQAPPDYFTNGARYNPDTDSWKPISSVGAPKGRVLAAAAWTGSEMIVWGGVNDGQGAENGNRFVGTGARYNPAADKWTEITTEGAPSPRLTTAVWTGDGLLTFGGYDGRHLNDSWFYSPLRTLYPYVKE